MRQSLASYGLYIDGKERPSSSGETFPSIDPLTGAGWARLAEASSEDVNQAVEAARKAFRGEAWGGLSPTRRGRLLMRLGDLIAENAERIARIETRDNGKLYREMLGQLQIVPDWFYYYGGLADKIEGQVVPLDRSGVLNYTLREPLGPVAILKPWNSPTLLTVWALAPALAAGNTAVVKPSEVTSASMIEIARLAAETGVPPGVINVVTGGPSVGKALVEHPDVAKVTFTGGTETGRSIARAAGERLAAATTLELGGKSPNIIFEDADLAAAEAGVLAGIFAAAGQTCVAGSRALVHTQIYDQLLEKLTHRASQIKLGDPMLEETQMGPIATEAHRDRIANLVDAAVRDGARLAVGGSSQPPEAFPNGYFYTPTILTDVEASSPIVREEVFGPVLCVLPFEDEEHAVALANDTEFGLAAGVWTNDVKRAHRMAHRLEVGTVWINTYRASTFNSPFGGYKASGVGRENGAKAIDEYLQTKSVWVELTEAIQDPFVQQS